MIPNNPKPDAPTTLSIAISAILSPVCRLTLGVPPGASLPGGGPDPIPSALKGRRGLSSTSRSPQALGSLFVLILFCSFSIAAWLAFMILSPSSNFLAMVAVCPASFLSAEMTKLDETSGWRIQPSRA